jgi:hypothetical protein
VPDPALLALDLEVGLVRLREFLGIHTGNPFVDVDGLGHPLCSSIPAASLTWPTLPSTGESDIGHCP